MPNKGMHLSVSGNNVLNLCLLYTVYTVCFVTLCQSMLQRHEHVTCLYMYLII